MNRKRKNPAERWLPSRVYPGKSAYEWHPKTGGAVKIAPLDAAKSLVWRRYEEEVRRRERPENTVEALINEFFESGDFKRLSKTTQDDYTKHSKPVIKVFGRMPGDQVKPEHVRKAMDLWGKKSRTQANHRKSLMSRVFSWAYERGKVPKNPCKGVRKFTLDDRDYYVTDAEYRAVYDAGTKRVKAAMEIAYLCATRISDVLKISRRDLYDEGLYIKQGKTKKKQIKKWTPRLRKAVDLALSTHGETPGIYVFKSRSGGKLTVRGFYNDWMEAKADAAAEAAREGRELDVSWHFHDLKAKGISDYKGDKQRFSGHKTAAQVKVYDRKPDLVDPVE